MSDTTAANRGIPTPRRSEGDDDIIDDGILHWNDRTVVRRVPSRDGQGTVIHKQALGPAAVERTRHEHSVLTRLSHVDGVPHLLEGGTDDTLVVQDFTGRPLASVLAAGRAAEDQRWICRLALRLVRIVAAVHDAGVVHRDLNPGNVLVHPGPTGELEPLVVDFDLATTLAQVRPSFVDPREIAGRLPYLAPEQTGRSAVPVDQRADLYALGATLYELATGTPPFSDDDPLHLVGQIRTRRRAPPDQLAPAVPAMFSRIVVRLLAKEPADRYQSAAGLAHDLAQVVADPAAEFRLGVRDFPRRLAPPNRLVGRDREVRLLSDALDRAVAGSVQGVLVSGGPGTGKTALINRLRPLVVARGGWFATGKADQYRHDATTTLFSDAMNWLGTLLLAEPEEELARLRERMLGTLGDNAGLVARLAPPFRQLLGVEPEEWTALDAPTFSARLLQTAPDLLREIVSPQHPLVLLLDDLQWASARALQTIEALLADPGLAGLLIIAAYRDDAVDAEHPLTAMVERWERLGNAPTRLDLPNLPAADVAALIAEMLRIPDLDAAELATVLADRTGGNPCDTIELINALRRDGALVLGERGWSWDTQSIRSYVGTGDVVDLLADRITRLPADCRQILRIMARLGTVQQVANLAAACSLKPVELVSRLAPALEDGLVVADDGVRGGRLGAAHGTVRFRHPRVQAAHDGGPDDGDPAAVLTLARRLAAATDDLDGAAQQYVEVIDLVDDPDEQRRVVELLWTVATRAQRVSKYAFAERYLLAAIELHARGGPAPDDQLAVTLDAELHAVLFALGRLDEADEVYARVAARTSEAVELSGPACVQITALTVRGRPPEALRLGLELLERLGVRAPGDDQRDVRAAAAAGLDRVERWLGEVTLATDAARGEASDPAARAAAALLRRLCPTAYLSDHLLLAWLVTEAQRLWADHGPQPDLVPCLGHANSHGIGLRPTMDLDHDVVVHALRVGESRGYRSATAHAHFLHAVVLGSWYGPLEDVVAEARHARDVLRRAGDLQNACFSYYPAVIGVLDCGQTLDAVLNESVAAIAMAQGTGNEQVAESLVTYRQFARALRGETRGVGSFTDGDFDEDAHLAAMSRTNPMAAFSLHLLKALGAVIFDDQDALALHLAELETLAGVVTGTYGTALLNLLTGLRAAQRIGSPDDAAGDAGDADPLAVLDAAYAALDGRRDGSQQLPASGPVPGRRARPGHRRRRRRAPPLRPGAPRGRRGHAALAPGSPGRAGRGVRPRPWVRAPRSGADRRGAATLPGLGGIRQGGRPGPGVPLGSGPPVVGRRHVHGQHGQRARCQLRLDRHARDPGGLAGHRFPDRPRPVAGRPRRTAGAAHRSHRRPAGAAGRDRRVVPPAGADARGSRRGGGGGREGAPPPRRVPVRPADPRTPPPRQRRHRRAVHPRPVRGGAPALLPARRAHPPRRRAQGRAAPGERSEQRCLHDRAARRRPDDRRPAGGQPRQRRPVPLARGEGRGPHRGAADGQGTTRAAQHHRPPHARREPAPLRRGLAPRVGPWPRERLARRRPDDRHRQFQDVQRRHGASRRGRVHPDRGADARQNAAHVPDDDHDPQTLIATADAALYEAKRAGRDQVVAMAPRSLDGE